MPRGQVLVVYKKSSYQLYVKERHDAAFERAMQRDPQTAARLLDGHRIQQEAVARVEAVLSARAIPFKSRWRGKPRGLAGFSLVLAVGGDGTLLDTGQWLLDDIPLLGVNSDPSSSVGKLCATTAEGLAAALDAIDEGRLKVTPHTRLRVQLDGQPVLGPCLNDVLYAHRSPAEMSRFELARLDATGAAESEPAAVRSSGVWISTATGSTAAIRSAGGKVMPIRSRRLQYLVREPYSPPEAPPAEPTSGFLAPGEALRLTSRMNSAFVWADGPHRRTPVRYGQTVVIDAHPQPLQIYRQEYR